jgi:hypothetical protein
MISGDRRTRDSKKRLLDAMAEYRGQKIEDTSGWKPGQGSVSAIITSPTGTWRGRTRRLLPSSRTVWRFSCRAWSRPSAAPPRRDLFLLDGVGSFVAFCWVSSPLGLPEQHTQGDHVGGPIASEALGTWRAAASYMITFVPLPPYECRS